MLIEVIRRFAAPAQHTGSILIFQCLWHVLGMISLIYSFRIPRFPLLFSNKPSAPVLFVCSSMCTVHHYNRSAIVNGARSVFDPAFAISFFLRRRIKINVYVAKRARAPAPDGAQLRMSSDF